MIFSVSRGDPLLSAPLGREDFGTKPLLGTPGEGWDGRGINLPGRA